MKKHVLSFVIICLSLVSITSNAQVTDTSSIQQSFEQYRQNAIQGYNRYRDQAKKDFEEFLAEAWTSFQCFKGEAGMFSDPKPEQMPAPKTFSGVIDTKGPAVNIDIRSIPRTKHSKSEEYKIPEGKDVLTIRFYGLTLGFHFPASLKAKANSTKEKDVARYYVAMQKNPDVKPLQQELEATMQRLGLNEYGYYLLLRSISEKAFTSRNDCVLFCFYMLHSHGFKARVGRGNESKQLMLLLAIDNSKEVYTLPFFRFNNVKYYTVYGGIDGEDAYSYDEKADDSGLKEIGLDFKQTLDLAACDKKRVLPLTKLNISIEIPYSTSHIRYYEAMPMTVFPIYFKSGLAPEAQQVLAETFGELSKRYNKTQLVDIILNFVQTAFNYKIDEEQFGHEKYFFPEEVIGYPYSDCEDRCALFAWLVRTFAQVEVVGVLYPDHLATGVYFGEGVSLNGTGFDHKGKHYMICDPTYTNASIGSVMPGYTNKKYEVVDIR